jgi:rhodanese-related sulfurtransferase
MTRAQALALAALLAAAASTAACSPRASTHPEGAARAVGGEPANPPPGVVDARTARALVAAGARVVDVRTPAEFAEGHVAGALNVPHDEISTRAAELGPKDAPILLYCRSGRRSAIAAEALRALGYGKVWDMQRYETWVAAQ